MTFTNLTDALRWLYDDPIQKRRISVRDSTGDDWTFGFRESQLLYFFETSDRPVYFWEPLLTAKEFIGIEPEPEKSELDRVIEKELGTVWADDESSIEGWKRIFAVALNEAVRRVKEG